MNDILTSAEVSDIVRVPEATLRYWRHRGDVGPKSFKVGPRRVMYRRADVETWLQGQYDAASASA